MAHTIVSRQLHAESYHSRLTLVKEQGEEEAVLYKQVKDEQNSDRQYLRLLNEHHILQKLHLAGVRPSLSMAALDDRPALRLKFIEGITLGAFAAQALPERIADFYIIALQLAETLRAVHEEHIIHKDLNGQNILINPKTLEVQLIDFGLASQLELSSDYTHNPGLLEGSLPYIAPEQTGRTAALVDFRADIYSLGVVFYEFLTRKLPFESTDPLELIHAHLALRPAEAVSINPQVGQALSDVIRKMLAKNPDERYQSMEGLLQDLQLCQNFYREGLQPKDFLPGRQDSFRFFRIRQKLYGRMEEQERMEQYMEQCSHGQRQLVLISGYSGAGKTSLVNTLHKPITAHRGYFIKGKFEQYERNKPYLALSQAFGTLINYLLTEPEEDLARNRRALRESLGQEGGILQELIPNWHHLWQEEAYSSQLKGEEANRRMEYMVLQFVRHIASAAHPLVLFVDDLQWADHASLSLLQTLMEDPQDTYLLIVGAYRSNEVDESHPLPLMVRKLEAKTLAPQVLHLEDLGMEDVHLLLTEAFSAPPHAVKDLSALVYAKTGGNPFFLRQFMQLLFEDGLIWQETKSKEGARQWQWDEEGIEQRQNTENVIALMSHRAAALDEETREVLQLAACIGSRFDLQMLSVIAQQPANLLLSKLWPALREGFIVPESQGEDIVPDDTGAFDLPGLTLRYRFLHDRVQQGVYDLIDEQKKAAVHLSIGRTLAAQYPGEPGQVLFDIVNQYNTGKALLDSPTERLRLSRLNLRAGEQAAAAVAHRQALEYCRTGIALLPPDHWTAGYGLSLALCHQAVAAAYLCGEYGEMNRLASDALSHISDPIDKTRIYASLLSAHTANNETEALIALGLKAFAELGIKVPAKVGPAHILTELAQTAYKINRIGFDQLVSLPPLQDERTAAVIRVLAPIGPALARSRPMLLPVLLLKTLRLSLKNGISPELIPTYSGYGLLMAAVLGKYDLGMRYGDLALRMAEQHNARHMVPQVQIANYPFLHLWQRPLRELIPELFDQYVLAMEVGDQEFAASFLMVQAYYYLYAGIPLPEVTTGLARHARRVQELNQDLLLLQIAANQQVMHNLMHGDGQLWLLKGGYFDEEKILTPGFVEENPSTVVQAYTGKLLIATLFGQYEEALHIARAIEPRLDTVLSTLLQPLYSYHSTLAHLGYARQEQRPRDKVAMKHARRHLSKLRKWAKQCPENFGHMYYLAQACYEQNKGRLSHARKWYDKAIHQAAAQGFLHDEALAWELAGACFTAQPGELPAQLYLQQALDRYQQWGAMAKVKQLLREYPYLRDSAAGSGSLPDAEAIYHSAGTLYSDLELSTVLKAARAISAEVKTERVLDRLLRIIMENAGAERGLFFLIKEDVLCLSAMAKAGSDEIRILPDIPLATVDDAPRSLINYVLRVRESISLEDARSNQQWARDPYIMQAKPRAVLCAPVENQQQLVGILYLENRLIPGAIKGERANLLRLLSGQMAISIENARLYASLEQKVEERTAQISAQAEVLKETNQELLALNEEKDQLMSVVAHDLRSPLNQIRGILSIIRLTATDLDEEQKGYLDLIGDSTERLTGMISRILDVNAVNAGKINLKVQDMDIIAVAKELSNPFRVSADEKAITLHTDFPQGTCIVQADRNYTIQVLENLLSNAIKFSPRNTQVTLGIGQTESEVTVYVQDQGPGLSDADMKKLFGRFQQLSARPTGGEDSSGLGLSIAKKYVEAMGAEIWAESEEGKGSTFFVRFPRKQ